MARRRFAHDVYPRDGYPQSPVDQWARKLTRGLVGVRTTIFYPVGTRYLTSTLEDSIVLESGERRATPLYPSRGKGGSRVRMRPFLVRRRNPTS